MAQLLTLAAPQYQAYNTSLAEIALHGIELGQREMNQRDENARFATEVQMKQGEQTARAIQQQQENSFKQREQERLEQAMVWQHQIDQERTDIARKGLSLEAERVDISRKGLAEQARQFDATQPLQERRLAVDEKTLGLRQAEEDRKYEEWNYLGGRESAEALNREMPDLKMKQLEAERKYNEGQNALDRARALKATAEFELPAAKRTHDEIDRVLKEGEGDRDITSAIFGQLKLADVKNHEDFMAGMNTEAPYRNEDGSPNQAGLVRAQQFGSRTGQRNTMQDITPEAWRSLIKLNNTGNQVLAARASYVALGNRKAEMEARGIEVDKEILRDYDKMRKAYTAAVQARYEAISTFDPTRALNGSSATDAAKKAAGVKTEEHRSNMSGD